MFAKRFALSAFLAAIVLTGFASAGPLRGISWQDDPEPGTSVLELRFDADATGFDVRAVPAGVAIRMPGPAPSLDLPDDVEYLPGDGGFTDLIVRRPGAAIASVRVDDGVLRVRLASRFDEGGSGEYRLRVRKPGWWGEGRKWNQEDLTGLQGHTLLQLVGPGQHFKR